MNNQLITVQEFASFRDIGKKLDEAKINECIKQAQSTDLFDVLNDFFFDLVENKDSIQYQDLLSGSTFSVNNQSFSQAGIKSLLADYTYNRYMYSINTNFTPFGATQKYGQDSQPVDRNLLKDIAKQTQVDADIKFKMIDKYLKSNSSIFTRYQTGNNPDINTGSVRYSIIK
ncbi:hypothetical protein [Leeuwenhoekiella sp. NPDC079379]|uniref:DUF6712 family protein n=1 Tax=Leeuwenhoekiella sp. NPDC079379 TaxID=3364122 RepID=UPI0037C681A5